MSDESRSGSADRTNSPSSSTTSRNRPSRPNLGILIKGLPIRSTDTSLRDGLYHEYKKYGKVTSVNVEGQGDGRYAIVSFKKPEEATSALESSQNKKFFGSKIRVTSHEGFEMEDSEFRPPEAELDEYHPKATRTLFVGNLEKDITNPTLKDVFSHFGQILDIDIKKQQGSNAYAFVQYTDIVSVVKALKKMDAEYIGESKVKLGFGKSMPTTVVWLDGLDDTVTESLLKRTVQRYGSLSKILVDKNCGRALVYYDSVDCAQYCVSDLRGRVIGSCKLQIDFASRDCIGDFKEKLPPTPNGYVYEEPANLPPPPPPPSTSRTSSRPYDCKYHPANYSRSSRENVSASSSTSASSASSTSGSSKRNHEQGYRSNSGSRSLNSTRSRTGDTFDDELRCYDRMKREHSSPSPPPSKSKSSSNVPYSPGSGSERSVEVGGVSADYRRTSSQERSDTERAGSGSEDGGRYVSLISNFRWHNIY